MKKYSVVLLVVALIIVIASWFISLYNGLIKKDEAAQAAWSQVENVYQRRMDLVPNLVNTVKGAADFERATLEDVVSARASASQVKIDANTLTEENIAAFQKAQDALSGSLSRLLLTVERYPELKATENFRDLQAQLEGTENRIAVERKKFNEAVRAYNTAIRRFPRNMVAKMFGFEKKGYFEAAEGAENAPEVSFNFGE